MIIVFNDSLVVEKTKWILCSDRLPTHEERLANNDRFIVTDKIRSYQNHFDEDKNSFINLNHQNNKYTFAWQPLPTYHKEIKHEH